MQGSVPRGTPEGIPGRKYKPRGGSGGSNGGSSESLCGIEDGEESCFYFQHSSDGAR
ncbi:hypothetical protein LINPERPRIM_LOCUS1049 [Linum perenne]